jgi:hypothetical protein
MDIVIARRPKADVAISYSSKYRCPAAPKRLMMTPTVLMLTK